MRISNSTCREIRLRDGRTLAYAEYGSPAGKPIIHCHGAPSARVEGDLIIDGAMAAALGLRVIVPDRPGMGRSDYLSGRRIVDWPNDVLELVNALGLDTFVVVGSSGGAPYALVCGALIPTRVRTIGVIGGIAPADAPGILASMSGQLRLMHRLARFAPLVLRALFRLNLSAIRRSGSKAGQQMAAWAPEPDRTLFQQESVSNRFMRCFEEACQQGTRGPALDIGLIARPWGFDPAQVKVPVLLWHGVQDRNVPISSGRYLARTLPNCRAKFYDDEAHLSLPLNHQEELLGALATA
jgi:pimeloyl-ACP methyl ester carboxylesterase